MGTCRQWRFWVAIAVLIIAAPAGLASPHDAVDREARRLTLVLEQEPPQLDSSRTTDAISIRLLGHIMEGLTRYDRRGRLVPGVARDWTIRAEGATFQLREEARWSDGEPVTAQDFVYAWQRALAPETASEYAYILYGIENAQAINRGDAPISSLGVEAVDAHTLEVRFDRPVPHFDRLVAFATYFPLRQDIVESSGDLYASAAEHLPANGPFRLARWNRGSRLTLERNPHYWAAEDIWLREIDFAYITTDTRAVVNLFQAGKVAMAGLDADTMHTALQQRWRIRRFDDGVLFYLDFNHRSERLTRNRHLRKALALTFDPAEFVNRVIATPGNRPGASLFPAWLPGADGLLRDEAPPRRHGVDLDAAREHLEQARKELGLERWPPLVLLTGDSPSANRQAEYLQSLWRRTLDLEIRIDTQIFRQRLARMSAGDYDLVLAGWGPDYADPLTFGNLYASWNQNNRSHYRSQQMDHWVEHAQTRLEPEARIEAFAEIQRIIHDDVVMLPMFERGQIYVQHPDLRGVVRRQTAPDPDFTRAWIE